MHHLMHYLKMYHWPKPQTNLGTIWDGCGGVVSHQKTTQKWPKTTDSAGKKIFENLKVWNCKFHINKTYLIYMSPQLFSFTENSGCQPRGGWRGV